MTMRELTSEEISRMHLLWERIGLSADSDDHVLRDSAMLDPTTQRYRKIWAIIDQRAKTITDTQRLAYLREFRSLSLREPVPPEVSTPQVSAEPAPSLQVTQTAPESVVAQPVRSDAVVESVPQVADTDTDGDIDITDTAGATGDDDSDDEDEPDFIVANAPPKPRRTRAFIKQSNAERYFSTIAYEYEKNGVVRDDRIVRNVNNVNSVLLAMAQQRVHDNLVALGGKPTTTLPINLVVESILLSFLDIDDTHPSVRMSDNDARALAAVGRASHASIVGELQRLRDEQEKCVRSVQRLSERTSAVHAVVSTIKRITLLIFGERLALWRYNGHIDEMKVHTEAISQMESHIDHAMDYERKRIADFEGRSRG